ncbi:hypothetical protein BVI434_360084 [Burkholderia vietnamiensis]|nr:hypothetical protein BVI434_360084 [Burkholderia vietnamiensis]
MKRHGFVAAGPCMIEPLHVTQAHDRHAFPSHLGDLRAGRPRFHALAAAQRAAAVRQAVQTHELDGQLIGILRRDDVVSIALNDQRRHARIRAGIDERVDCRGRILPQAAAHHVHCADPRIGFAERRPGMQRDRREALRMVQRQQRREARTGRQAGHVHARGVEAVLVDDDVDQRRDGIGFAAARPVGILIPVPATVRMGAHRLLRIQHGEPVLIGQQVHPRALRELVGRLLAAVQHHDERHRTASAALRHVQRVRKVLNQPAERGRHRMLAARPFAGCPCRRARTHARLAHRRQLGRNGRRGGLQRFTCDPLRIARSALGSRRQHAFHAAQPYLRQTFGHRSSSHSEKRARRRSASFKFVQCTITLFMRFFLRRGSSIDRRKTGLDRARRYTGVWPHVSVVVVLPGSRVDSSIRPASARSLPDVRPARSLVDHDHRVRWRRPDVAARDHDRRMARARLLVAALGRMARRARGRDRRRRADQDRVPRLGYRHPRVGFHRVQRPCNAVDVGLSGRDVPRADPHAHRRADRRRRARPRGRHCGRRVARRARRAFAVRSHHGLHRRRARRAGVHRGLVARRAASLVGAGRGRQPRARDRCAARHHGAVAPLGHARRAGAVGARAAVRARTLEGQSELPAGVAAVDAAPHRRVGAAARLSPHAAVVPAPFPTFRPVMRSAASAVCRAL